MLLSFGFWFVFGCCVAHDDMRLKISCSIEHVKIGKVVPVLH